VKVVDLHVRGLDKTLSSWYIIDGNAIIDGNG
jgi:hypothetical protein